MEMNEYENLFYNYLEYTDLFSRTSSVFVSSDYVLLSDHFKVLRLTLYQRSFNRNINPILGSSSILVSESVGYPFLESKMQAVGYFSY